MAFFIILTSALDSRTDIELINDYKSSGDNKVVGVLFERYTLMVFGVCMKYLEDEDDSKDAVMQIFEKLLVDLKKHEIENFRPWLHSVAKNHCLMEIRKNKKINTLKGDISETLTPRMEYRQVTHQGEHNNKERRYQLLEKAITMLNSEQRRCIELFYLEEKSYQEVSDLTGYSMNEVKSYIQNGKRNLKIKLDGKLDE